MSDDSGRQQSHASLPPFPESAWRGVFADYLALIDPISECPSAYHFPNLLALIAAELGDWFCFDEGGNLGLNFYILNCGISGTKKSVAMDFVRENVAQNLPSLSHARVTSVSSGEGLIRLLMQQPNLLLAVDEIKSLFVVAGRQGSRVEELLNTGYSCKQPLQGNIKDPNSSQAATNYYLNVVINGTPDHIIYDCSAALFKGGLFNRFLVFAAPPTTKNIAVIGKPNEAKMIDLAVRISAQCLAWRAFVIGKHSIRVGLTSEASALFESWYTEHNIAQKSRTDLEAGPLTRLDVYVKKLSSVYCLLETPASDAQPLVSVDQMQAAIDVAMFCRVCMIWLSRQWTGQRALAQMAEGIAEQRAEMYLLQEGCMPERQLYRHMKVSHQECQKVIVALQHHGILEVGTAAKPRMLHVLEKCTCEHVHV